MCSPFVLSYFITEFYNLTSCTSVILYETFCSDGISWSAKHRPLWICDVFDRYLMIFIMEVAFLPNAFMNVQSRQSAYGKVLPGWHYAQRLRKPVISHSIDATLLDIMDLIYRDFILSWFQNISGGQSSLRATIL